MNELLVLLLPLAAFTGWWLARTDKKKTQNPSEDEYFQGLSYLLEDETDKAIDVFFRIAHVDDSAVENQITLGNLFRHRGELDRALHIHNSLKEQQTLTEETRQKLNLALAADHYQAGIMNHAESFYQLVRDSNFPDMRDNARRQLIKLYAEQSQWEKAIEVAEELDPFYRDSIQKQVAHYHCEIAKKALTAEPIDAQQAQQSLRKALRCDEACARAVIMLGRWAKEKGNYVEAIGRFQRVEKQNPSFVLEIVDDIADCYQALDQQHEWRSYLTHLVKVSDNPILILRLNQLIAESEGREAALAFLSKRLAAKPNILTVKAYLTLINADTEISNDKASEPEGAESETHSLVLLQSAIDKILGHTLKYRCRECGFRGNQLNWQCPGCKEWGTFTPVSDVSLKENVQ